MNCLSDLINYRSSEILTSYLILCFYWNLGWGFQMTKGVATLTIHNTANGLFFCFFLLSRWRKMCSLCPSESLRSLEPCWVNIHFWKLLCPYSCWSNASIFQGKAAQCTVYSHHFLWFEKLVITGFSESVNLVCYVKDYQTIPSLKQFWNSF